MDEENLIYDLDLNDSIDKMSDEIEKLCFAVENGSSTADLEPVNPQEVRKLITLECARGLVHASQCQDANCQLLSCQKLKQAITHVKICKEKSNGGCHICKQIIALCCYHAKHCQETECLALFCSNIKRKLEQKQSELQLEATRLSRTPMDVMNTKSTSSVSDMQNEQQHEPMEESFPDGTIKEELDIKEQSVLPMANHDDFMSDIKLMMSEFVPFGETINNKKYIFKPDELKQALMATWQKLYLQSPESLPFRQPVDAIALGIPDYLDIIKHPMDLSTIKNKLDTDQYSDPWDYIDDIRMIFDNAWRYYRKTSRVYRYSTKLSEVFDREIDPVMQALGFCCGRKYTFKPQVLLCYGEQFCTIPQNAKYYSYENSLEDCGLGSNKYTFCEKCFNDIPGVTVTLADDPTLPQTAIRKDQFQEMENNHIELEPFVFCNDCGRKFHQICVLHMESNWPFECDNCLKMKGQTRQMNKFNAKRLPVTKLGSYLETKVNNFLRRKDSGAGEVTIRVVSSSDKVVEVKPGMRRRFVENGDMPGEFPYRSKALLAFEEIDGTDVCFFGMYVQEYGGECMPPNARRVYISHLDSVTFFQPKQFRTAVYHEILIGYLDYAKQLGYTMAHIWACPPSEGDDFIFYCRPTEQKFPKFLRIEVWIIKMLDKAMFERIVVDYKDIQRQAMEDRLSSAAGLPYFEGDFWPNVLEEIIEEINHTPYTNSDLNAKIFATMEKHRKAFFTIRLHSDQSAAKLGSIQDPEPLMNVDFMDGPEAFLMMAREKHYEFSSLRRAKFSSMSMLDDLHNQRQEIFAYMCNNCQSLVKIRYHCTVCDDFDLCTSCREEISHPHYLEKLGSDLGDGSLTADAEPIDSQEARKLSILKCIQLLAHACQCLDVNCQLSHCRNMKRVVTHAKVCEQKTNGDCPICKQLIALCCNHAKHCTETECLVLFCSSIKCKLEQKRLHQRLQQRLQQALLIRRRIDVMNSRPTGLLSGVQRRMQVQQHQEHSEMSIDDQMPPQADVASGSNGQVVSQRESLRQLMQVLRGPSTPDQQNQILHILKHNPALMRAFIKQRQAQTSQRGGVVTSLGPRQPHHQQRQLQAQHTQQQQPQQNQMQLQPLINQQHQPQSAMGSTERMPLQKLMQVLRSPSTPDQQNQILHILRGNPALMTAFINQRQSQQPHQPQ